MKHAIDAAPALSRGLALLRLLEDQALATLEELARRARLPKASALRLLRALQAAGLIARETEGKRWRAIARIVPTGEPDEIMRARHVADLEALCRESGQVAELYQLTADMLRMIDRREPALAGVTLRAQIGFVRKFDEVEAVAQLALAHGAARVGNGHWHYRAGKHASIPARRLGTLLGLVKARGWAADIEPNQHGVRRIAAPLMDADGRFVGALAIAAIGPDAAQQRLPRLRDLLLVSARRLRR